MTNRRQLIAKLIKYSIKRQEKIFVKTVSKVEKKNKIKSAIKYELSIEDYEREV